ncbi:MAG: hypothetical protein D5R99_07030 [Methanocalculus sp. MSAO_Arc1]|uniref:hypothetical protein n=1 Tax=Methanocalculus TaxID=71151 RepID=UPI000FF41B35|nr:MULTISPECIES: hypothetical protein [unclassified Methanocalculus]MCP1661483.1 hypothetical protein [Methanocalculus sp. AMF5]RQD79758.1 MAG: hypothetical protein D5R99_07030 [Methanocalculus sp. MSAO_Arc1]
MNEKPTYTLEAGLLGKLGSFWEGERTPLTYLDPHTGSLEEEPLLRTFKEGGILDEDGNIPGSFASTLRVLAAPVRIITITLSGEEQEITITKLFSGESEAVTMLQGDDGTVAFGESLKTDWIISRFGVTNGTAATPQKSWMIPATVNEMKVLLALCDLSWELAIGREGLPQDIVERFSNGFGTEGIEAILKNAETKPGSTLFSSLPMLIRQDEGAPVKRVKTVLNALVKKGVVSGENGKYLPHDAILPYCNGFLIPKAIIRIVISEWKPDQGTIRSTDIISSLSEHAAITIEEPFDMPGKMRLYLTDAPRLSDLIKTLLSGNAAYPPHIIGAESLLHRDEG